MKTFSISKVGETTINSNKIDFIASLPLEISKYILCHLSRSLIDNCRLVSKSWDSLIKNNSKSLPKHQYTKIKISSNSVFRIFVKEKNMEPRQLCFQKKYIFNNTESTSRKRKYVCEVDTSNEYTVMNEAELKNILIPNNPISSNEVLNDTLNFKPESSFWEGFITFLSSQPSNIYPNYFSQSINYSLLKTKRKKDKVPCEKFFDTLRKISQNSFIDILEFEEITLNDEMIDGIIEALKKATIGTLSISFAKLTYCSPLKFLTLFDRLNLNVTRGYRVNWARMATNEHFSISDIVQKLHLEERKTSQQREMKILDLGLLTDFNNDTIITKFNIKEIKMLLNAFLYLRIDGSNINLDILKEIIIEWKFGHKLPKTIYFSNCPLTIDLNTIPKIIEFSKDLGASINKNGETIVIKGKNESTLTLKIVKHPNFGDQLQIDSH